MTSCLLKYVVILINPSIDIRLPSLKVLLTSVVTIQLKIINNQLWLEWLDIIKILIFYLIKITIMSINFM